MVKGTGQEKGRKFIAIITIDSKIVDTNGGYVYHVHFNADGLISSCTSASAKVFCCIGAHN